MKLKADEARKIVYGYHEEWETIQEKIAHHGRWAIKKTGVFQQTETGLFYRFRWEIGATEHQDKEPFEYVDEYEPQLVVPVEKKIIEYEAVSNKK